MDIESDEITTLWDRVKEAGRRITETLWPEEQDTTVQPTAAPSPEQEEAVADLLAIELARLVLDAPMRVTAVPSRRLINGHHFAKAGVDNSQVVGFQPDRMRITILNFDDTNEVWIGGTPELTTSTSGLRIAAGSSFTLETQAAIYARASSGETATLAYLIEFGD